MFLKPHARLLCLTRKQGARTDAGFSIAAADSYRQSLP